MATAPCGAVALRCQAADPGIARKPGGGNLVGEGSVHQHPVNASSLLWQTWPLGRPAGKQRRRTNVLETTVSASGLLGIAHPATMQDRAQTERSPVISRQIAAEFQLHLDGIYQGCEAESLTESQDMGVDRQSRQPKRHAAHDVARLAAHAGQCHQVIEGSGNLTIESFDQHARHPDQALGLVLVEAGRTDDLLDCAGVSGGQCCRGRIRRKQLGGHHIDTGIGGLSRHDRRYQQLEGIAVVQLADRLWIDLCQSPSDFTCTTLGRSRSSHSPSLRMPLSWPPDSDR